MALKNRIHELEAQLARKDQKITQLEEEKHSKKVKLEVVVINLKSV